MVHALPGEAPTRPNTVDFNETQTIAISTLGLQV